MPFTLLTNKDVLSLFSTLTKRDTESLLKILYDAMRTFSTQNESPYQPARPSVKRTDTGLTTTFMPATSPTVLGVKVLSIVPPTTPGPGLSSVLTLCDPRTGKAVGVMSADELTGFRTALGSMILLPYRKRVGHVVCFGAGKQAFWHLKLALILRPGETKRVTVVNRSRGRAQEMVESLEKDGCLDPKDVDVQVLDESDTKEGNETSKFKDAVQDADVIFCTTPSRKRIFPGQWLMKTKDNSSKTMRPYIAAIGSWQLDMMEIDPELLKYYTRKDRDSSEKGTIFVDSRDMCYAEAGEVVAADIKDDNITEVGAFDDEMHQKIKKENGDWIEDGFVIYKSVGFAVMDISTGSALLKLAKEKHVGIQLDEF